MKITIDEIMQLSRIFSVRISSDKVVENFFISHADLALCRKMLLSVNSYLCCFFFCLYILQSRLYCITI